MRAVSAEDAYLFTHTLLREAAYELHLPSERARLHGLALAAMERVLSRELPAHLRELAEHAGLAAAGKQRAAFRAKERTYLRRWAAAASVLFDYQAALDAWLRVAHVHTRGTRTWVAAMTKAANACRQLSSFARGRQIACEALKGLSGTSTRQRAELEQTLGSLAYGLAEYPLAARHARRAQRLARAAKSRSLEALAVNLLGIVVWSRGDLRGGLRLLTHSERLFKQCGDTEGMYLARMNCSIIHCDLGDLKRALMLQMKCLQHAQRRNDLRRLAPVLSNLGIVYRKLGNIEAARDTYLKAIDYARACGNRELQAANLCNIGNLESLSGRMEEGFASLCLARDIARELGDRASLALYTVNLSPYYEKRGEIGRALELLDEGIVLARETGAKYYEAAALSSRAALQVQLRRFDDAAASARESVAGFEAMGLTDGIEPATARAYLTIALAETGRTQEAQKTLAVMQAHKRSYLQLKGDPDPDTQRALTRMFKLLERR